MLFIVFFIKIVSLTLLRFIYICILINIERHILRLVFIKFILFSVVKKFTGYCICHEVLKKQWQTILGNTELLLGFCALVKDIFWSSEFVQCFHVNIGIIKVIKRESTSYMNSNSQTSLHIFVRTCWGNNSPFIGSMLYCSYLLPEKNASLILKKVFKDAFHFP